MSDLNMPGERDGVEGDVPPAGGEPPDELRDALGGSTEGDEDGGLGRGLALAPPD